MWCTYCTISVYVAVTWLMLHETAAILVHILCISIIMQPCMREPCTFVLEDLAPLSPVLSS